MTYSVVLDAEAESGVTATVETTNCPSTKGSKDARNRHLVILGRGGNSASPHGLNSGLTGEDCHQNGRHNEPWEEGSQLDFLDFQEIETNGENRDPAGGKKLCSHAVIKK